jgi:hypothetical protein
MEERHGTEGRVHHLELDRLLGRDWPGQALDAHRPSIDTVWPRKTTATLLTD